MISIEVTPREIEIYDRLPDGFVVSRRIQSENLILTLSPGLVERQLPAPDGGTMTARVFSRPSKYRRWQLPTDELIQVTRGYDRANIPLVRQEDVTLELEPGECIHGLLKQTCGICRHGPARPDKPRIVATFPSKYAGHCSECNLPIQVSQIIARMSTGKYIHADCAD